MKDEWVRINMRLPIAAREWLKEKAYENRRSMNNELLRCVEAQMASKETETAAGRVSEA